jgi:UDP-N-acetylglucosamine--N-acetylmuramyl-(pentapeptide) pyrophosphoryl-undecaprenol N-acetylglucosamine transferase
VLGLGGYAAGVAVKMCGVRGIPSAILNPDVVPGKANQYLMRYAQAVCCQFERTRDWVSVGQRHKLHITGCPIRCDIANPPPREEAMARLGLDAALRTLVVTGASQGAKTVNEGVLDALKTLRPQGWQVLHLAGREHAAVVEAGYRGSALAARVVDFTPAMADVWACADLAICRAGASTCAELAVCGVPAVLMPYPFHRDKHQRLNAQALADAGAAVVCDDEMDRRKNGAKLAPVIEALLRDAGRRQAMSKAARTLARPAAAEAVAGLITQMVGSGR